jgi:threonine dehydrogenase-like Zn-dependent dehydrogenase
MEKSFGYVAHGGSLVFVGVIKADISFADAEFHKREMSVLASRNATRADFEAVVRAIAAGRIDLDALNTHRASLVDLPQAMPDWLAAAELPLKAVLTVD